MPDDYDLQPVDYQPTFAEPFAIPQTPVTPEQTARFREGAATLFRNTVGAPGIVAQPIAPSTPGMWSDEDEARRLATEGRATDWAPQQALNMVGQGAPMAVEGAAGVAGGKLATKVAEYAGEHTSPGPGSGAPLHDVTLGGTYPKDFYGPMGQRYYAPGNEGHMDASAYNKIASLKDKPDEKVKIYRAVPWEGKRPGYSLGSQNINPGDWVTINRQYAMEHGESALNGNYAIAVARVPAKELFTAGDSYHEWGWHPEPKLEPIRAYHGSPHDFERFDISKIGTGEGAQSYGHGLYFAENPEVAHQYRDNLAGSALEINGKRFVPLAGSPEDIALAHLEDAAHRNPSDPYPSAMTDILIKADRPYAKQDEYKAAADILKKWDESGARLASKGRAYEVAINANPEHFLDWDKPLSEQHPEVQKKLHENWLAHLDLNQDLNDWHNTLRGWEPGTSIKQAREAGIPGIKYLDQGSRGPGTIYNVGAPRSDFGPYTPFTKQSDAEAHAAMLRGQGFHDAEIREQKQPQTSNYVVFSDDLIQILRKYGIAGLTAGLAAGMGAKDKD